MAKLVDGSWYELRIIRASHGEVAQNDKWTGNLYYGASIKMVNYYYRTETSKTYEADVLRIEKRHVNPDRTFDVLATWHNPDARLLSKDMVCRS